MGGESDPTTEAPSAELTAEPRAATLPPEARARLERLEAWRRETAAAEGTPAYIVLRNETLEQLAVHNPQTLAELGEVKGIGPVKLERYGEALLRVLRGDTPQQR
ncbi:HRDC domain-containing protein [Truepera radiovictrix]|nr:HRDC domain-containing protein [Truepera radiovictrix]